MLRMSAKKSFFLIKTLCVILLFSRDVRATVTDVRSVNDIFAPLGTGAVALKDGSLLTEHDLFFFDLDNTVVEPDNEDMYGGDVWLQTYAQQVSQRRNMPFNKALLDICLPEYFKIQQTLPLRLVEPLMRDYIQALQKSGVHTLALSSRSQPIMERTIAELGRLGVDFSQDSLARTQVQFASDFPAFFDHGIIFGGPNKKGVLLEQILTQTSYKPARVLFIDDKLKYADELQKMADKLGLKYVGFRYGFMDEKNKAYQDRMLKNNAATKHTAAFIVLVTLLALAGALVFWKMRVRKNA